jgi:class 3 adenylate cyclase
MAKFCSECGVAVAPTTRSAEYKQVTVLFADVVHSMDIAATVGAERLREIMAELADRAAAVVRRYRGTVAQFTGDGIMAVFGAPLALEDHAIRACLAALGVQDAVSELAAKVQDRDAVDLRLRVGLNSGQVIAGEIGSGTFGYTAIGEHVGMAQRMESVAPPGGVMLSESTARLVDGVAGLGELQLVEIKGVDEPVPARRLLGVGDDHRPVRRTDARVVGRRAELSALGGLLDRAIDGDDSVVAVVGSPGIGKSRLVHETIATARRRGVDTFSTFCESHACDIPFHVARRLLRDIAGIADLDDVAARARVHARVAHAVDEDVLLLHDVLGIRDSAVPLPNIDPDARRRRLTALIDSLLLARATPAVYVIEDVHWIDQVSELFFADFLAGIAQTHSMLLITYRPEYRGVLAHVHGAHTFSLAPLSDREIAALLSELLGTDPSVSLISSLIAGRAAGNPFFAEEMVRDLAERGVLAGRPGAYVAKVDVADVEVPATLQATIGARIDRLGRAAKRTLNAAAVIGSRFTADLLSALVDDADLAPLAEAELVEQVMLTPRREYAFRHPLIRAVAYESQLKSDRARLHRSLAIAIEEQDPNAADANASLIAQHSESAGDLDGAYAWHMRAGAWSAVRDLRAARRSWDRARQIADVLIAGDRSRTALGIASRTLLCGSAWRVNAGIEDHFEELRQLCALTGDKVALVLGMTGVAMDQIRHGRVDEASRMASEYMTLVESIEDSTLTVRVTPAALYTKYEAGDMVDVLRWSQRVIDLVEGDMAGAGFSTNSPLAAAFVARGNVRLNFGFDGWRDDLDRAVAVARRAEPMARAAIVDMAFAPAIVTGARLPNDDVLREVEEALQVAEQAADDIALGSARLAHGLVLVYRGGPDAERGLNLLLQVRDMCMQERFLPSVAPQVECYVARQVAHDGDYDTAIPRLRAAAEQLFERGNSACWTATEFLVVALLGRGADADIVEAQAAIDRFACSPTGRLAIGEILLFRLRALLARACGDDSGYRDFSDRYGALATSLGFELV